MGAGVGKDARVAWLVPSAGYSGRLLYWPSLWRGVGKYYRNCTIFCPDVSVDGHADLPVEHVGRLRIRLPARRRDEYTHWVNVINPIAIFQIYRFRPELIITVEFGILTLYGLLVARLLRNCRILLLVESGPNVFGRKVPVWRTRLRRLICAACHLALTNNRSGRDYLVNDLGMLTQHVRQGVWLASEPPAEPQSTSTKFACIDNEKERVNFLYVGQLIERKGLRYLLLALAQLTESERRRCRAWILGSGSLRTDLEGLTNELALGDVVRFLGQVSYEGLGANYRRADVFVFPTLRDYWGMVSFEALAYGLPLLISVHAGAAEEVVEEGRNGFRFDPRDTEEFARLLSWMINNGAARAAFGKRSREISNRFTIAAAVSNLVAAAADCLAQPRRGSVCGNMAK